MRTLTLKISDDYFDKFVAFLEMMPKKSVKIETTGSKKEIDLMQNSIKQAMSDIDAGRSKVIRVVD
jgi:hypothetical protein